MTPFSVGLTWGKLLPELANGPNKALGGMREGWAKRVEKNNSFSLLLNLISLLFLEVICVMMNTFNATETHG